MNKLDDWWKKPRSVSVLVDYDSWILPYAQDLVDWANKNGDQAKLCRHYDELLEDGITFLLGCIHITPKKVLQKNHKNLVVHESDLPKGKGFAPMTWQILAGENVIPICLFEACEDADSGPVVFRDNIVLEGHELCEEWRALQGQKTLEICKKYLNEKHLPSGQKQDGEESFYKKRSPKDSALDPQKTIAEQFPLLRVVHNEHYPAFFEYEGYTYTLKIEKVKS